MKQSLAFHRRGIVEGFFGPPWSMAHRRRLMKTGAAGGMNTYLYAPKDDPYHRDRWMQPYPGPQWQAMLRVIAAAHRAGVDFVYGFHPGKGLSFTSDKPVRTLLSKAQRFYDAGVRTFAVLFDDIPSRLEHTADRRHFKNSLARAEGTWMAEILSRQPDVWRDVEWWICPSYYTPDPLLARVFGEFEPDFLETLAQYLPQAVACCWTGPLVVSRKISLSHVRKIAAIVKRPLILWDNYPVNDLSMRDELHIAPLQHRDPRLPQACYGYLTNPLLQEELGFIPLATCFDYAARPGNYNAEKSWNTIIKRRFGSASLAHWRAIRMFCKKSQERKNTKRPLRFSRQELKQMSAALDYIRQHPGRKWAREMKPWRVQMEQALERGGHRLS